MVRVGINGLGIMGRYLLRAIEKDIAEGRLERGEVEVVAFNDLAPVEQLVPLVSHDSVYLGFPGKVEVDGLDMLIDGRRIVGSAERNPLKLNWDDKGVDVVYDASGIAVKTEGMAEAHLVIGANKVILSAPSPFAKKTIVIGVNDDMYKGEDVISNASCTTNCLAPLAIALYDKLGDYIGLITSIHGYTGDQNLVDGPHKNTARGYAAALNFIPTSTGAAKAIGKVIPGLDGKLDGMAVRGPVAIGSIVDLVAQFREDTTPEQANKILEAAANTYLAGTLEYRDTAIVSSMVLGSPTPCVVDGTQTRGVGNMVKFIAHYDNVAGYSHQAVKLIQLVGKEL